VRPTVLRIDRTTPMLQPRRPTRILRRYSRPSHDLTLHPGMETIRDATDLLLQAHAGDPAAVEHVFPLIYEELHRLAHRQLMRDGGAGAGQTLSTTALVHEAYLRLIDQTRVQWTGRAHFMAIAATAMRRILIDRARSRGSLKRGGGRQPVPIESVELAAEDRADLLLALDEALTRLHALDPRQAQVVECRFFGGMTEEETAAALGIGLRTAKRDWAKAKSWLYREVYPESDA
jgi:RNA polymerase sigma-70 factor (ECF subfamily)